MEPWRFGYDLEACGVARALATLGEKWSLLVIREAFYGVRRFDDFLRALGCGRAILSERLKTLTDAGVLERLAYQTAGQRPRFEYGLTPKGLDLYPALLALSQWADRWDPAAAGPAAIVTGAGSGRPVEAILTDDPTVARLGIADLAIRPGPGARRL